MHLGHADAGPPVIGFDKYRELQVPGDFVRTVRPSFDEQHGPGYMDAVERGNGYRKPLVESEGRYRGITTGIGQPEQIEIALQLAILAGCSVNTDQHGIENNGPAFQRQRKIIFVDRYFTAVRPLMKPPLRRDIYTIYGITVMVKVSFNGDGAFVGDAQSTGIPAGNERNGRFHEWK